MMPENGIKSYQITQLFSIIFCYIFIVSVIAGMGEVCPVIRWLHKSKHLPERQVKKQVRGWAHP